MADPVAQILEQAQNVSGGAPFGDFFVRGVQSAQQDRQLDQRDVGLAIERENTRIADVSMGLKLREGRAEQLVKLAEQEQDLNFTNAYQAWIERGAHKKDIPNLMGMVNGTSPKHRVVEEFFERVGGINAIEDAANLRAAINQEEVDQSQAQFDLAAQRAEAAGKPLSSSSGGGATFRDPAAATSKTTRINPDTGEVEIIESTGGGPVGEGATGITSKFQEQISSHEIARANINSLREVADPGSFGVDGLLASANNRLLAPAKAFFGFEPGVDVKFAALQKRLAQVRTAALKSLKVDAQMGVKEFAEVEAGLPELGVFQTFDEFNVTLNELETVNNLGEYVKRRNVDGIPMQPMLDRMGRSEVIEFITRGVTTKLMSKSEARNLLTKAGLGVAGN
jgi:hypothetical protein